MTKEGNMTTDNSSLFNFTKISASLLFKYRSLKIELKEKYLTSESLFELESAFNWACTHPEINAIILTSQNDFFSLGWCPNQMINFSDDKIYQINRRIHQLIQGMYHLPQTVICDLKEGVQDQGLELSLGADIRIAQIGSRIEFCSLHKGMMNASGGMSLLSKIVSPNLARQWNLMPGPISQEKLTFSGFILEFYGQDEAPYRRILSQICQQSALCRIQTKRALLESVSHVFENYSEQDYSFSTAALGQRDWQEYLKSEKEKRSPEFESISKLSKKLREEKGLNRNQNFSEL